MKLQWRVSLVVVGLLALVTSEAPSEGDCSAGCARGLSLIQVKRGNLSTRALEGAGDNHTATVLHQTAKAFKTGTSTADEEYTGSIQGVHEEVVRLARQHITEKKEQAIDKTTNATLDLTKEEVESIISTSATAHAADQTAINNLAADANACHTVAKDSFENSTHGINLKKSRMVSARSAHATSRAEEGTANSTHNSNCQEFLNKRKRLGAYANDPTPPTCLCSMSSVKFFAADEATPNMRACITEVAQWSIWLRDLKKKMDFCSNSSADTTAKIAECKEKQASFEQNFCTYKEDLDTVCDQQDSCLALTTAALQNQTLVVRGTERLRKLQYKTAVTVKCLLGVFRTEGITAKQTLFESCQSHKNVSTSHLDITYPPVPTGYPCAKEANEPCSDEWLQAEYGAQPWGSAVNTCKACLAPAPPPQSKKKPPPQSYPPAGPTCYFFDKMFNSDPQARGQLQCRDYDADGDLDCIMFLRKDRVVYYKNDGYPNDPRWVLFGSDCTSWNTRQNKGIPDGCSLAGPESPVHNMITLKRFPHFMNEFRMACHDFDGDGDYDCLGGFYQAGLIYYRNDGTPSSPHWTEANDVTLPPARPWGRSGWHPVCQDFDKDGDIDCVIGSFHGGWAFYAENVGTPTAPSFKKASPNPFEMLEVFKDVSFWGGWDAIDIDGDGDYDLVNGPNAKDYTYRVIENTGTPTSPKWADPQGVARFPFLKPLDDIKQRWTAPFFLDYDKDGDMDLLMGTQGGPVRQFENIGTKIAPEFKELKGTYSTSDGAMRGGCATTAPPPS